MEEYLKEVYLTEKEVAAITKDALSTLRNNRHVGRDCPTSREIEACVIGLAT
jgi:hypothetical protein